MSTNIFITPGLLAHISRSVIEGFRLHDFKSEDGSLNEFIQRHYASTQVRLWGVKDTLKGLWKQLKPGDWILFYHSGEFPYCGKVLFLYPFQATAEQIQEATKIAENVWGKDPRDGKTWPYLLFLTEVRKVKISLEKFNELTGYRFKALPGKAVMRFMKVKESRAQNFLAFLNTLPGVSPVKPPVAIHDQVAQKIYELGEVIGYKPEKKWRKEGYEYDVVWHKPPREGPKCVFEVHIKGNLGESLLRLKHAHDRWESQLFLISTEDQINEAKSKYLVGALHELAETGALTLVKIGEIEEFHQFKGRFEWLERRFGLRPR